MTLPLEGWWCMPCFNEFVCVYWGLDPFSTLFELYRGLSFYSRRKPATPITHSVAVNLRAPAGTDQPRMITALRVYR